MADDQDKDSKSEKSNTTKEDQQGYFSQLADKMLPIQQKPIEIVDDPFIKVEHPKETFRILYEEGISDEGWEKYKEKNQGGFW